MISLRIWAAFLRPFVAHPLFQQRGVWSPAPPRTPNNWKRLQIWLIRHEMHLLAGTVAFVLLLIALFDFWTAVFVIFIVPMLSVVLLAPLSLLFIGNIYGLMCAFNISTAIINEKMQGRYNLLGLTPYGFEGVTWALCSLTIHNNQLLLRMRTVARSIYMFVLVLVGLPFVYTLAFTLALRLPPVLLATLHDVTFALVVVLFLGVEFVQSANAGCMIGMIAPTMSSTRLDNRNRVIGLFLAVQAASYLIAVIVMAFMLYTTTLLISATPLLLLVVALAVFYGVRELAAVMLWQWLMVLLEADIGEFEALIQMGIQRQSLVGRLAVGLFRLAAR